MDSKYFIPSQTERYGYASEVQEKLLLAAHLSRLDAPQDFF